MGFKEFLLEGTEDLEAFFQKVEKDCKPFLKHKRALWRGLDTKGEDFGEKKVRQNRTPLVATPEMTTFVNAFLKKNKLPLRTNSLFALNSDKRTEVFGDSCLIFPKGKFKFVWFPEIIDLNSAKYNMFKLWVQHYADKKIFKMNSFDDMVHAIQQQLLADTAREAELEEVFLPSTQEHFTRVVTGLEKFNNKKLPATDDYQRNEIMIECKDYYFLRKKFSVDDSGPVDQAIKRFGLKTV